MRRGERSKDREETGKGRQKRSGEGGAGVWEERRRRTINPSEQKTCVYTALVRNTYCGQLCVIAPKLSHSECSLL
jgi:hypothetical protein